MRALKQTALAATLGALLCLPITPAMAAGPLLFAPWLLGGHVLGGLTRLATIPLVAAYGASQAYYAPAMRYPYYSEYYSAPRYYAPPRGYYAPATRYPGYYGAQASYRSRGYSYRRR
jgi:hypothetical protein